MQKFIWIHLFVLNYLSKTTAKYNHFSTKSL